MIISEEAKALHRDSLVMDIHCHPSLKVKLFEYRIYDEFHYLMGIQVKDSDSDEIGQMQYDLFKMFKGGVNSIWSSIYIVEKGLIDHSDKLSFGTWLAKILGLYFTNIIENPALGGPFKQSLNLMRRMEEQILESHLRPEAEKIKAYNPNGFSELVDHLNKNEKCILHSVEGAHMLGRNLANSYDYINNLETFFERGVCSMTLGHFMPNDICFPINGISPQTKKSLGFEYDYSVDQNNGLTNIGKDVVKRMLELGIIVDLNHVSPNGREDVYALNDSLAGNKRPLVFSHTGIRLNCPEKKNPTLEEIKKIQECGGVIGVIFMNYWLRNFEGEPDYGISNIIKTIKDISIICGGSYDNIAIGSDMDGFTQPVDDLYTSSQMQRLTQGMLDEGISPDNIKKVLGLNALRVLDMGWGKI